MNDFVESLNTEIGFPCIHRRQKKYIVPNVEEKLDTWELVFDNYFVFNTNSGIRKMAYKTFYRYSQYLTSSYHPCFSLVLNLLIHRYMKAAHPDFTLSRKKEDECDTCIRLEISLADKTITVDNHIALMQEQKDHWNPMVISPSTGAPLSTPVPPPGPPGPPPSIPRHSHSSSSSSSSETTLGSK